MILNIAYSFLNNVNDKDILNVILNNIKVYIIGFGFYTILYLMISYTNNKVLKKIFYVIFIMDLVSLVIHIISNTIPDKYNLIEIFKNKISLYKK